MVLGLGLAFWSARCRAASDRRAAAPGDARGGSPSDSTMRRAAARRDPGPTNRSKYSRPTRSASARAAASPSAAWAIPSGLGSARKLRQAPSSSASGLRESKVASSAYSCARAASTSSIPAGGFSGEEIRTEHTRGQRLWPPPRKARVRPGYVPSSKPRAGRCRCGAQAR